MVGYAHKIRHGFLAVGIFAIANVASAGDTYVPAPYCWKDTDGSGYCHGYYSAFRNSANGTDNASYAKNMYSNGYIDLYFYARLNDEYYSCYAPPGSFFAKQTDTLLGNYFWVSWDANGTCTNIESINLSNAY